MAELVEIAGQQFGVTLRSEYLVLLRIQNGGYSLCEQILINRVLEGEDNDGNLEKAADGCRS